MVTPEVSKREILGKGGCDDARGRAAADHDDRRYPRDLPARRGNPPGSYVEPAEIDTVVYTHMHLDHVNASVRQDGEAWSLAFPNATFLIREPEWSHWAGKNDPAGIYQETEDAACGWSRRPVCREGRDRHPPFPPITASI